MDNWQLIRCLPRSSTENKKYADHVPRNRRFLAYKQDTLRLVNADSHKTIR